jgi:hypothetical protein
MFHIYSNKNRPGQYTETKNIEKDRLNKQGKKTQENVKINESVKNGKPTNFRESINVKNKRSFDDGDLEARDFSETINYQMGSNGQYTESINKNMGRPGGKFQETVNEVIKGYVTSWFAKCK